MAAIRALPAVFFRGGPDKAGTTALLASMAELTALDLRPPLAAVSAPTLVACGEKDKPYLADSHEIAATIPGAQLRLIPGAGDIVRALQRDGHPTPLGDAIASYGRIFKSFHVLAMIDDESYRRDIKGIRNLQEGRHGLAGKIFHGRKGQIYERYHAGIEDQLGALGLVLNCVVLWNIIYMNAALDQLRSQGYPVRSEGVERLSPFVTRHLNVHGHYSFNLPDLGGGQRP